MIYLRNQLKPDTMLGTGYRIVSCIDQIRHGEYDYSSFIYDAKTPEDRPCWIYEYFPDSFDCVATRGEDQTVLWNMDKIRTRMQQYRVLNNQSPAKYLDRIFRLFSEDAKICRMGRSRLDKAHSQVLDCVSFKENGTVYVILPDIRSQFTCTLYDRINSETVISSEEQNQMLRDITNELDMFHRNGITHGAISPWNILFKDGRYFLSEFGKPKARKFSNLSDWNGPAAEGRLWIDPDSPEWYNDLISEKAADFVSLSRVLDYCQGGEWERSAYEIS